MLDNLSLDQLRTFVAAVDEGSFSAAARKLNRVQSAVSDLVAKLEANFGVALFNRSSRHPTLTKEGTALLADARSILTGIDTMRAHAKGISSGIEAELSVVVDVMFPISAITDAAKTFRETFPRTSLRMSVEVLGGAYEPLLDARANIGIVGPLDAMPADLTSERLAGIRMEVVAAGNHPLSAYPGKIPVIELAKHVQLILTDRSTLSEGKEMFVRSPFRWHLADLFAKRAFLLEGLGWGYMPRHSVENDIKSGGLVVLSIEDMAAEGLVRPASAAYLTGSPPGPAGRWFIEHLKQIGTQYSPLVTPAVAIQKSNKVTTRERVAHRRKSRQKSRRNTHLNSR